MPRARGGEAVSPSAFLLCRAERGVCGHSTPREVEFGVCAGLHAGPSSHRVHDSRARCTTSFEAWRCLGPQVRRPAAAGRGSAPFAKGP
eukprot:6870001-Prymnesium_polylepis.1